MDKKIASKTIIISVLDALEQSATKERPLTIASITRALNESGTDCDRRTVSRNVGYLIGYGKPIVKTKGGYFYEREKDRGIRDVGRRPQSNKKTLAVCVLDVIKAVDRENDAAMIKTITNVINDSFRVKCDRRTVSRNLGYLIDYGKPIVKTKRGYYWSGENE